MEANYDVIFSFSFCVWANLICGVLYIKETEDRSGFRHVDVMVEEKVISNAVPCRQFQVEFGNLIMFWSKKKKKIVT